MSTSTATTNCGPEAHHRDGLLAPSGSPRRAGALAASATFGWRAMLKIKHDPKQLTDVIAIPVLFTVLFTYIFGGTIGGTPGHYLTTLLPGTLVMGITACTMYGGARLAKDMTTGVFDRFRSLAVWRGALVLGGLLSDAGRYLLAAGIVVSLGVIIGYRPHGGVPGVIAAVALVTAFGLSLSWLWAATALLVRNPATVMSLGLVVTIPPTFASNIFVEPRTMPGWLQAFVNVNPISHLAEAARDLMNNTDGAGGPVTWSLVATAAITLVFAPLTLHFYGKQGWTSTKARSDNFSAFEARSRVPPGRMTGDSAMTAMTQDMSGDPEADGRLVRLDDGDMHVVEDGNPEAPALLLIHGTAGSTAWWDPVVPALAGSCRVIRVDLLGHGRSSTTAGGYGIPAHARQVGAALDRLGAGRVTVIGHSMGCMVATALAEQRPDKVRALTLIDMGPSLDAVPPEGLLVRLLLARFPGRLLWRLRNETTIRKAMRSAFTRPIDIPDAITEAALGMTHPALAGTAQGALQYMGQQSLPDRLAALGIRVLVIFGTEDARYPSSSTTDYRVVPGARVELLPGVGHTPMMEDPETTGTLLLEFVAAASPAR